MLVNTFTKESEPIKECQQCKNPNQKGICTCKRPEQQTSLVPLDFKEIKELYINETGCVITPLLSLFFHKMCQKFGQPKVLSFEDIRKSIDSWSSCDDRCISCGICEQGKDQLAEEIHEALNVIKK